VQVGLGAGVGLGVGVGVGVGKGVGERELPHWMFRVKPTVEPVAAPGAAYPTISM
jgi:hypothetical protein